MPDLSICISTYNQKHALLQTLGSICWHAGHDFEVIIVDDGSTDGTDVWIAGLGLKIKYFKQSRLGHGAAKEHLIALADSRYIVFLDAGDMLLPDALARFEAVAVYDKPVCGYAPYVETVRNGTRLPSNASIHKLPSGQMTKILFKSPTICTSGSIYPLTAFKNIKFDHRLLFYSDYEADLQVSLKYDFILLQHPVLMRKSSDGKPESSEKLKEKLKVLQTFYYERGGKKVISRCEAYSRFVAILYKTAMCLLAEGSPRNEVEQLLENSPRLDFKLKVFLKMIFN